MTAPRSAPSHRPEMLAWADKATALADVLGDLIDDLSDELRYEISKTPTVKRAIRRAIEVLGRESYSGYLNDWWLADD